MKHRSGGILLFSSMLAGLVLEFLSICPARGASWATNGPMMVARSGQTATLLPNGKVLVAGGCFYFSFSSGGQQSQASLSSAELYDPATGTWTNTGSLNEARYGHTATLLPNGKVLVVGGISVLPDIAYSAELYDPATGTWTTTTTEPVGRYGHTATLLSNGKVLVVGGYGPPIFGPYPLSSSELFDPSTETWTNAGATIASHASHSATLLPNGKVLIAGGASGGFGLGAMWTVTNTAELYSPTDGTWTVTGSLNTARESHTATLLPNGLVLVAGGYGISDTLGSAELYNPSNETWTMTAALNTARYDHSATLMPNGNVLVTGGICTQSNTNIFFAKVEVYSPSDGTWTPTVSFNTPRYDHAATLLPSGKVLISGGIGTNGISFLNAVSLSSTEVYDPTINPTTGTWTNTGDMDTHRSYHTATLLPDGKVLVAGGGGDTASAETYNPADGTWTNVGALKAARGGHTATLLPNGQVLVAGGFESAGVNIAALASAELYDPGDETWRLTGPMTTARAYHTAALLPNGKVLVAGGQGTNNAYLSDAEIYDPASETWNSVGSMTTNRAWHTATLLADGKVLVAGGVHGATTNFGTLDSAELFDPGSGAWTTTGAMTAPRAHHTATLLPNGEVLAAGGNDMISTSPTGAAGMDWSSAELFDPVTGTWTATGSMSMYRDYHTATLLPDGKVLVAGNAAYVNNSELFDPATGAWSAAGDTSVARFNQTATLLPDGTLMIAGGMYPGGGNYYSSAELYDVGLCYSNSWQPQIASITSPLNLGSSLVITGAPFRGISECSSGNTQDSSADYPLVQLRSIEGERTVFLSSTNWGANSFTSLPIWNFPPGYALATVFVNGIQSTSSIVNVGVPIPATTTLNSAVTLGNGKFQFSFTNNPGALFGVLATTNLSAPLTNWKRLGGVVEIAPGQFQFTDPQAMNGGLRYYSLFAP